MQVITTKRIIKMLTIITYKAIIKMRLNKIAMLTIRVMIGVSKYTVVLGITIDLAANH